MVSIQNRPRNFTVLLLPHQKMPYSRDSDTGRAGGLVALGSHDHVVVGAEVHAGFLPGVEEGLSVDAAGAAFVLTNGPELLEGLGAIDGGGIRACCLVQLVDRSIHGDLALESTCTTRVVAPVVLNDVVLNQLSSCCCC